MVIIFLLLFLKTDKKDCKKNLRIEQSLKINHIINIFICSWFDEGFLPPTAFLPANLNIRIFKNICGAKCGPGPGQYWYL